eukprot:CAMPEP_0172526064 /NCGR_PEP_ID=MMETSP1067-20121228/1074_1 /TAXON_ID=265564 ORGANISM="Thalassiosira punctigera, Strain Tpunct2005C2" /NCGR_SAMPLE_ID=MMETSP1067 /ASSEMBLY_ACC=CAM_ASM_000444 /LENGTH=88 /DNA_ID=CAMNT_0013309491 /DNA_START=24 /DNA_END=289 /DNA_ORIENTATION=-
MFSDLDLGSVSDRDRDDGDHEAAIKASRRPSPAPWDADRSGADDHAVDERHRDDEPSRRGARVSVCEQEYIWVQTGIVAPGLAGSVLL